MENSASCSHTYIHSPPILYCQKCGSYKEVTAPATTTSPATATTTTSSLENRIALLEKKRPELIRTKIILPLLQRIQLHQATPTIEQDVPPNVIPSNAVMLLVSVYLFHGNHPSGHAYLCFDIHQAQSNTATSKASVKNYSFAHYFNSHYYEILLPWNSQLPHKLVVAIKETYNTGCYQNQGNQNFYDINIDGYMTF